jgi:hypothetical protein
MKILPPRESKEKTVINKKNAYKKRNFELLLVASAPNANNAKDK